MSDTGTNKFDGMSDGDLFYSVGSSRPRNDGLAAILGRLAPERLKEEQDAFDEAVKEMMRRDAERGFPYHIPKPT
jgi:hypothetical protein